MVFEMFKIAADLEISPRLEADSEYISTVMFSNKKVDKLDKAVPDIKFIRTCFWIP